MVDKRIRIILDKTQAQRNAKELDQSVQGIGQSADKSQFSVKRLAAAIAAVISVQKITSYAESWSRVQNQLARTASTQEELVKSSEQLLRIANDTRANIETTVELYTSLRVSTEALGVTQEQTMQITKTINNLFLESGKSAQESAGAIRQLGQALQSGALRGDEFNSVAEGAPGILRAIELQTGKTRGELRELAAQGGITAELIVKSLENYSEQAQIAADKTSITLDQAFNIAGNNASFFIGTLDDLTGASSTLAEVIVDLSERLFSFENINTIVEFFDITRLTIDSVTKSSYQLTDSLEVLSVDGTGFVETVSGAFKNFLPNVKALVEIVTVELLAGIDKLRVSAVALYDVMANSFDEEGMRKAMETYEKEMQVINGVRQDSIEAIVMEREAIIETAKAASASRAKEFEERQKLIDQQRSSPIQTISTGGKSETQSDTGQREIAGFKAGTQSLLNELNLRRQISDIYRQQALADDQSYYQQQLAASQAKQAEELAVLDARAAEDRIRRDEQFRQALENEKIQEEERLIIKAEQDAQNLLAEQLLQEQRTAIYEQGKKAREDLDRAEWQARLANAGAFGNALMQLGQGQSKKIFKIGQTLALAQAAVALPTAVMESFKNGGGYPWGLVPAGIMLATGLKNIQQIKNAGAGLGGGGGATPNISLPSGGGASSPSIPNTASTTELTQQRRIIDLRGVKADDKITVSALAALLEDDGAIVAIEGARQDAERRNVIGVTAR